jgi:hypothetical protein
MPVHFLRVGDHRSCRNEEELLPLDPARDSEGRRPVEKEISNSFLILNTDRCVKWSPGKVSIGENHPNSRGGPVAGKLECNPRTPSGPGGFRVSQKKNDLPGS